MPGDDYEMCWDCEYTAPVGSHDVETVEPWKPESERHKSLKKRAAAFLRRNGYRTKTEYWCKLSEKVILAGSSPQGYVRIDVIGLKSGRPVVAIECGNCCNAKLELLTRSFKEVWHWPFNQVQRQIPRSDRFSHIKINYGIEPAYHFRELLEGLGF